jgi:hypothetical protein
MEIASTRRPAWASAIAHAAAHVVLPTPPLPAKKVKVGLTLAVFFVTFYVNARDPVSRRHGEGALPLAFHFPDRRDDVTLDLGELSVGDLAQFEAHLRFEEHFAERRIVLRLVLRCLDDLVEHEAQASNQQRVKDEHGEWLI